MTPIDPYADVRDKMTRLATLDREVHTSMNSTSAVNSSISENMPIFVALPSYIGYAVLIAVGHVRDLIANFFRHGRYLARSHEHHKKNQKPLAVLLKSWENFYTRRIYHRVQVRFIVFVYVVYFRC